MYNETLPNPSSARTTTSHQIAPWKTVCSMIWDEAIGSHALVFCSTLWTGEQTLGS